MVSSWCSLSPTTIICADSFWTSYDNWCIWDNIQTKYYKILLLFTLFIMIIELRMIIVCFVKVWENNVISRSFLESHTKSGSCDLSVLPPLAPGHSNYGSLHTCSKLWPSSGCAREGWALHHLGFSAWGWNAVGADSRLLTLNVENFPDLQLEHADEQQWKLLCSLLCTCACFLSMAEQGLSQWEKTLHM